MISALHNVSVVQGAIRPATVSSSVFNEVHIHDFSCAFRIGPDGASNPIRERGMLNEAAMPYLAPECTGRVGKSPDWRSDYYSLGASFYEIFTGKTPFADAKDPLDLIHAHIAKRPAPANTLDSSIPEPLNAVIAKLLEKAPEDRYQTSQGLIVDLERISDLVRKRLSKTRSRLGPENDEDSGFIVGSIDEAGHFRLPPASKLYGRTDSMELLLASYEKVEMTNKLEVVVVSGPSGIGKSCLVETLRKPVVGARGFYAHVKFGK